MISFIVPSYNQGSFIRATIESVLCNMEAGDEILIADGASTDQTREVCAPFLTDPRVRWFSEKDRGFSDAVQKALDRTTNPIVGIMSSDDLYVPGIREEVLDEFLQSDVDIVYGDYDVVDIAGCKIGQRIHGAANLRDLLSLRVILPQSSTFFRRSALAGLNILSIRYDYVADVVLFNQIAVSGKFRYVPRIWSSVRKQPGSRTGKKNPGVQYLEAVETLFGNEVSRPHKRAALAGGLLLRARYEASSGQRIAAVATLCRALALDPFAVRHWLLRRILLYVLVGPRGVARLQATRIFAHR